MSSPLPVTTEIVDVLAAASPDLETAFASGVSSGPGGVVVVEPLKGFASLPVPAKVSIVDLGALLFSALLKNLPQVLQNGYTGQLRLYDRDGNPVNLQFDYGVLTDVST